MLSTPADRPYGHGGLNSKYQGQSGPTPSQYWRNFAESTDDAPSG
jgi:dCTP deaminase